MNGHMSGNMRRRLAAIVLTSTITAHHRGGRLRQQRGQHAPYHGRVHPCRRSSWSCANAVLCWDVSDLVAGEHQPAR